MAKHKAGSPGRARRAAPVEVWLEVTHAKLTLREVSRMLEIRHSAGVSIDLCGPDQPKPTSTLWRVGSSAQAASTVDRQVRSILTRVQSGELWKWRQIGCTRPVLVIGVFLRTMHAVVELQATTLRKLGEAEIMLVIIAYPS